MGYWLACTKFVTQRYWEIHLSNPVIENNEAKVCQRIIMHFL